METINKLEENYASFLEKQISILTESFPNKTAMELIEMHNLTQIKACLQSFTDTIKDHKDYTESKCMEAMDEIKSFTEESVNELKVYFEGKE